jgi:hypothetical protein
MNKMVDSISSLGTGLVQGFGLLAHLKTNNNNNNNKIIQPLGTLV